MMAIIKRGSTLGLMVCALAAALLACSPKETLQERLSRAESVSDVVEAVIHITPSQAYVVTQTKYLAVVFERSSTTRDYPLLKTKELMPVLLEQYPEVDRFFLAWARNGSQFLKIEFERESAQHVNWVSLRVKEGDVERVSSMFWTVPALR